MARTPRPADLVRFRAYRDYEDHKAEANNAMMALLAGARLSAHMLKLTEGSTRVLPDIFPAVEHIDRVTLKPAAAREILLSADTHLGMMAVPYVLSLHEDYLRTCVHLLAGDGRCNASAANGVLAALHTTIQTATGYTYGADTLNFMDTLRLMRNCVIHNGRRVNGRLHTHLQTWTTALEQDWDQLAGNNPRNLQVGDTLEWGHGEMIVALAVTKRLDRETNLGLQTALSRSTWARLVVDDLVFDEPKVLTNKGNARKKAQGMARHYYRPLNLTDAEIDTELASR